MQLRFRIMLCMLICSFIYLFIFQIQAIWPFTIDDMYISLRYAKNWASGFGLVWNIGEPPVEGYSNFSYVLLGRMAIHLGLNPVDVLKSIGVVSLALTCVALYNLSRFWFLARFALIPCFWLLAYKGQILWSVSGLETTLYQALIAFSVVYIFKGLGFQAYPKPQAEPSNVFFVYAGILLALASMTRPEAPAFMALFVCLTWFNQKQTKVGRVFFATFLLCFAGYFFWRWHYFGRLFPNSVYCKGMTPPLNWVLDKHYLRLIWPFALLAVPAVWHSTDRRHYYLWLPSALYSILLMGASPLVAFDNRLFLAAFVLMLPLTLQGMHIVLLKLLKRQDEVLAVALYLAAALLLFFCIPMMSLSGYRHFTQNPLAGERLRDNVLNWLEKNTQSSSRVVLADSGFIPWRSKLRFIDSYCLNNADMTRDPLDQMYPRFCKQVLSAKPEVIILTALIEGEKVTYTPADACLAPKLKSGNQYQLQASLSTRDMHSVYRYEIYQINRDL